MVEKSWTYEQVLAAQDKWDAERGTPVCVNDAPLMQWSVLHHLDRLEERYDRGDKRSVLRAVQQCADHQLTMPEWVAEAVSGAIHKMEQYEVQSWDEAFGDTNPKGAHLEKARERQKLKFVVAQRMREIILCERETAIDDALFERVAAEMGIGKRRCKEFWCELSKVFIPGGRKKFYQHLDSDPGLARIFYRKAGIHPKT